MSEPISDEDLRNLRLFAKDPDNAFYCHVDSDTLAEIIARLDAAEAKLERIRKAIPRNQYLSLSMLVEVKEIVHG